MAVNRSAGRARETAAGWIALLAALSLAGACRGSEAADAEASEVAQATADETLLIVHGALRADDAPVILSAVAELGVAVPVARSPHPEQCEDLAGANWSTRVEGTTADYFPLRRWRTERGAVFADAEGKVAVLGQTVARQLFGKGDPIGQSVHIRAVAYEVLGVLAARGTTPEGLDQDDVIVMPYASFVRHFPVNGAAGAFDGYIIVATPSDAVERVRARIRDVVRERHRLGPDAEDDVRVDVAPASFSAP